ncbi:MAG: phosphoribosylanthranilate isomerase [Kiritimatiellae bacterium]|nr:phosphoribosylanthranilate isomerase [Kiritimatiellia bacterium]
MRRTTEIKICGLTNLPDARMALDAGADYLGFVLHARSPRHITPGAMRRLLDRLPTGVRAIAVFVNAQRELVEMLARDCRLHAVQLHGDERAADWVDMPVPAWRAARLRHGKPDPAPDQWPATRYVLDAAVPGRYGGTGRTADWAKAAKLSLQVPLMLAGGLIPDNVAEAIRIVAPLGVDTASGVEKAPGKKDHRKVAAFIKAVREVRIDR